MRRRRHINADPDKPTLRSTVAAATEPVREAAFVVEEKLVWKGSDRLREVAEDVRWRAEPLRKIGEVVKWPLERVGWTLERLLVWPLQERTAGAIPNVSRSSMAAAGAILAGLAVLGVVLSTGGGGNDRSVVSAAPTVAARPVLSQRVAPTGPLLHGAAPDFRVEGGVGVASESGGEAGDSLAAVGSGGATALAEGEDGAATSSTKPVPAGPAAMKVARRFAQAFVFYEIGKHENRAATVFHETASPNLAEALVERPPRLPANSRVPRAKVLNLVPGPRRGRTYTVSVSLLRVGVTSELRLEMLKAAGNWTVTDVRG